MVRRNTDAEMRARRTVTGLFVLMVIYPGGRTLWIGVGREGVKRSSRMNCNKVTAQVVFCRSSGSQGAGLDLRVLRESLDNVPALLFGS
jgi:hypothetical protein